MFGMGFTEMLVIAIVAIIFLGPEKLPGTMVEIAKMFKKVRNTVLDLKESVTDELQLDDIKNEALSYKKELLEAKEQAKQVNPIDQFKQQTTKAREEFAQIKHDVDLPKTDIFKPDLPNTKNQDESK
jgi:sec-independent protein translocase protein TatB